MFSGSDRVLRRGAERWERSARERLDDAEPADGGESKPGDDTTGGRHRVEATKQPPWRHRPRAPLESGLHRLYLTGAWLVVALLWAGGAAAITGPSVTSRMGGVLTLASGVFLVSAVGLYLRRPVKR